MNIRIRGINDYLCFEIKNDLEFNRIYDELKSILLMLPESKNGYYPKALFHFEMKKLSKKQMTAIIDLIYDTKKVLFGGILKLKQLPCPSLLLTSTSVLSSPAIRLTIPSPRPAPCFLRQNCCRL